MTSIEKIMIGVMALLVLVMAFSIRSCNKVLEDNGGLRNVIVEAGKEVKEISKEINKEGN